MAESAASRDADRVESSAQADASATPVERAPAAPAEEHEHEHEHERSAAGVGEEMQAALLLKLHVVRGVDDVDDTIAMAASCPLLRGACVLRAAELMHSALSWSSSHFTVRQPPRTRNEDNDVLVRAASYGLLDVCAWMAAHSRAVWPSEADSRLSALAAFRSACSSGNLEVARWLASRWRLTPSDARERGNMALCMACWGGQLDVAQWLCDEFLLDESDARGILSSDAAVTEWLSRRFGGAPRPRQ
jgi:hypothetical protein